MLFTTTQRIKILRYLDIPYTVENKTTVWTACDNIETEGEELVTETLSVVTQLETLEAKEQQAFVDQGGMTKADVIEWDPEYVCRHIRGQKCRYRYRLASLLNLLELVPSAVENVF
jgi:hypothetical protein